MTDEDARDPDNVRILVNSLLGMWEDSIRHAGILKLVLNDCCPDWKHHYPRYVHDPGAIEQSKSFVAPLREASEAILRGEEPLELLARTLAAIRAKPH